MTDADVLATRWRRFGQEGWRALGHTTGIEISTAAAVTPAQSRLIDRVIREAMPFQAWHERRRRERRCVPAKVFDEAIVRQTRRLAKALLRLRKAGCTIWWALAPDGTTIRLFFVPTSSFRQPLGR